MRSITRKCVTKHTETVLWRQRNMCLVIVFGYFKLFLKNNAYFYNSCFPQDFLFFLLFILFLSFLILSYSFSKSLFHPLLPFPIPTPLPTICWLYNSNQAPLSIYAVFPVNCFRMYSGAKYIKSS